MLKYETKNLGVICSMWNAKLYNKFANERKLPSIDLATRVQNMNIPIKRILDVGCGSGLSTLPLVEKWSDAEIIGVDLSNEMLIKAKDVLPSVKFYQRDCSLPLNDLGKFDLIFSNAFIQWIENKKEFIDNCFDMLTDGGVFACQIPLFELMPASKCLDVAKRSLPQKVQVHNTRMSSAISDVDYCNILSNHSDNLDVWTTDYYHIMNCHEDIVEFMSSTALRPYQQAFDNKTYDFFIEKTLEELKKAYPSLQNGKVLFPFKRLFVVATKSQS